MPVLWIVWLTVGTFFYASANFDGDYAKGFYMAVNVGYSIGWGNLTDQTDLSKCFSIVYLLIGAVFLSNCIVLLVEKTIRESDNYLENKIVADHIRSSSKLKGIVLDIYVFIVLNNPKLLMIYTCFIYVMFGAFWSCVAIKWSMVDGVYFAVSSLSTGGLLGVPHTSNDHVWATVGIFAALGVPIMAMAVGNVASLMFEAKKQQEQLEIGEGEDALRLSKAESQLLFILNADASATVRTPIDSNKFLLMQLVRSKRVSVAHLRKLRAQFSRLDTEGVGSVPLGDIMAHQALEHLDGVQHRAAMRGETAPYVYPGEVGNALLRNNSSSATIVDDLEMQL